MEVDHTQSVQEVASEVELHLRRVSSQSRPSTSNRPRARHFALDPARGQPTRDDRI